MECSKLELQVWAILIFLIATNLKVISSMKPYRDLDITQKSAWFLAHRIRETFEFSWLPGFNGPIEADETFMGGKRRNISHDKHKGVTGRGTVGKSRFRIRGCGGEATWPSGALWQGCGESLAVACHLGCSAFATG